MDPQLPLITAFLIGLFGSVHCIGMCGGIVSALTFGLPAATRVSWQALLPYLLTYNAGRIASYSFIGAVLGALGAQALNILPAASLSIGRVISGGFMIALGLYLGGWWPALAHLERFGGRGWRRIEPWGRRFLPVTSPLRATALGLVWGWLPCGMVYTAAAFAFAGGNAVDGALRMAAFGLGTLPMLLVMGGAASRLAAVMRRPGIRATAAVVVIAFGVWTVLGFTPAHH